MDKHENPIGTIGFEFIEYSSATPQTLIDNFAKMGFDIVHQHQTKNITHLKQDRINFIINTTPGSHALDFNKKHGPCVSAMGFYVKDAEQALKTAVARGAKEYDLKFGEKTFDVPAIYGIGDCVIYFIDNRLREIIYSDNMTEQKSSSSKALGLTYIDHVTHNVYKGNVDKWANYYIDIFNFFQIRTFDIQGKLTGLFSRAMSSPCGGIVIPLNEATDDKSQIAEYLDEYKGEGIQHIALGARDIYDSVEQMIEHGIDFLHTPDTYYRAIDERVPNHGEDLARMQKSRILIDGKIDKEIGILLQIFTKNAIGPVFFEIIRRKGNKGFGEGNFQALFEAIELDQIERGVLNVD